MATLTISVKEPNSLPDSSTQYRQSNGDSDQSNGPSLKQACPSVNFTSCQRDSFDPINHTTCKSLSRVNFGCPREGPCGTTVLEAIHSPYSSSRPCTFPSFNPLSTLPASSKLEFDVSSPRLRSIPGLHKCIHGPHRTTPHHNMYISNILNFNEAAEQSYTDLYNAQRLAQSTSRSIMKSQSDIYKPKL